MLKLRVREFYEKFCSNCESLSEKEKIIEAAARLSYRASVQHALWKNGKHVGFAGKTAAKNAARAQGERIVADFLTAASNLESREAFLESFEDAMDVLRAVYHDKGITWYTYGNAQKWLAMAIKYYIVISLMKNKMNFSSPLMNFVLPVDGIMIRIIREDFGIDGVSPSWSQCDDKGEFIEYLNRVRAAVNETGKTLMEYEITAWNN